VKAWTLPLRLGVPGLNVDMNQAKFLDLAGGLCLELAAVIVSVNLYEERD
jgi:hypothetical protein